MGDDVVDASTCDANFHYSFAKTERDKNLSFLLSLSLHNYQMLLTLIYYMVARANYISCMNEQTMMMMMVKSGQEFFIISKK